MQTVKSRQSEVWDIFKLSNMLIFLVFRDLGKIDDLMQDITEQQDVAREISEAISSPFGDTYDEVGNNFLFPLPFVFIISLYLCCSVIYWLGGTVFSGRAAG